MDENDYLTDVMETYEIKKTEDGAESQGNKINVNSHVSMNMWGLTPEFVGLLEEGFVEFFENIKGDEAKELKGEYLLPIYIDELLKKGKVSVKLLETQDKWFGVTYKEDKPVVVESFAKLIADGVYRERSVLRSSGIKFGVRYPRHSKESKKTGKNMTENRMKRKKTGMIWLIFTIIWMVSDFFFFG